MTLPLIDANVFESLQANAGADFVVTLVAAFVEDAPQLLATLRDATGAGERERFVTAAHSLKSNAVAFGALRLADAARRLEWQGAVAEPAALDRLQADLDATLAALKALAQGR
jgi:histidine phosphotransfer protein HptB